jgi:steroid delta-isomerase-like uncharacterized protein
MAGTPRSPSEPTTAAEVAATLYCAYNRHDAASAAALYTADGEHREIAQGRSIEGRAAIEENLRHFLAAFPDARWEMRTRVEGASAVAITYELSGTLRGPLGPLEPRGQELRIAGCHVVALRDGEIALSEDYWDAATFMRQMRA